MKNIIIRIRFHYSINEYILSLTTFEHCSKYSLKFEPISVDNRISLNIPSSLFVN